MSSDDAQEVLTESERAALVVKRGVSASPKHATREPKIQELIASCTEDETAEDETISPAATRDRNHPKSNRLTRSDADSSAKKVEPDVTNHLIEIISFREEDQSEPSGDRKRRKNPRRLPLSADDTPGSLQLEFPKDLPGARAPGIKLPESDDDHPERTRKKLEAIDLLFPAPRTPKRLIIPTGRSMTLEELEELALQNNPTIVQAKSAITMSQGTAIQAGVSPNPNFGYESDSVGSSFTPDYQGIFVSQAFKTGGKLGLQRAVANMDVMNSTLRYERTKLDVLEQVRTGYYNVLVAQEAMKINDALVRFSNQVYEIMVNRLKNDEQAGYELSQLQTLVNQAHGTFVASQNRYVSAWKQLASFIGLPEMRPSPLEGRVDIPVPNLDYDALLDWVLNVHPDLHASRNLQTQSQLNLDLQKRIPIPDVTVAGVFENDFTTPGFNRTIYNMNVSVPVPIFDKNQGNIRNAQGKLNLSAQQYQVTKNALTIQLADAFERYQSGRVQSEYYRNQILPDMARAYRGVFARHLDDSDKVAFGDIIVAQQNLAGGVSIYINFLLLQWAAAADIANLIQLRNFRELFPDASSGSPAPSGPERTADELLPPAPKSVPMEGDQP